MIIAIALIGATLLISGAIRYRKVDSDTKHQLNYEGDWCPGQARQFIGFAIIVCALIVAIILMGCIVGGWTIQEKIDLIEAENSNIDSQILETVESYKDYEQSTFDKVSDKSADVIVQLYPELKSDELVAKQIEIYTDNKQRIISLKEDLINQKPYKWWLYFGG